MANKQSSLVENSIRCISLITCILTVLSLSLKSQDANDRLVIKDLNRELAQAKDITQRTYIIYDQCLYYQIKDYQVDSVLYLANELIKIGKDNNHIVSSILGHRMLGSQYTRNNRFVEGRNHLIASLRLSEQINFNEQLFDTYNPLAKGYYQENQLDSALFYFNECIESAPRELHSKHCYFHIGIAAVHQQLGNDDLHEKHLLLSYDNALKANIKLDQIIALTEILDLYSIYKVDAISFNKYKRLYDGLMSQYQNLETSFHSNFIFLDSLSEDQQIEFLTQSLDDNKLNHYVEGAYFNYIQLQSLYLEIEDYKKAVEISDSAIDFNNKESIRLELLVEIFKNKWLAESQLDNPSATFATIEYYHYLKDSLTSANNSKYVNELAVKYETAKKDAQLSEMILKTNQRTAQRNYAILLSGMILTVGYLLWRRSKYKQSKIETENRLQAERIVNLEKEKKILSLTSMLEGQEAERTRIAQDLHDGLGGLLSTVRNHFSMIDSEIHKLDNLKVYDRTNSMIDQACKEVRRISHNLMPASLQLQGLIPAITQYCQNIEKGSEIEIIFEHNGLLDKRLDDTKEIFIYRIIQEAVNNVIKHADATLLLVQLGLYENEINLIVEDNGKGFDITEKKDGIGIQSIKSRIDHINGRIDFNSHIGEGTTITINIPYEG